MALERDSFLANDGIVRSYNTTELYCMICESDTSYATSTKHIASLLHQRNLQWFGLLFKICDNNVKCQVCNTVVPWGKLKIHSEVHIKIPWSMPDDSYDKYKIFFENQIFQWKDLFHCGLCDDTFISCDIALIHITNPNHQSLREKTRIPNDFLTSISVPWVSLVCEGLVPLNAKELQCRICNCKSVTLSSVERHIKGLMHLSNKSRFQLKLQESEMNNLVTTVSTENYDPEELEFAQTEAMACAKDDLEVEVQNKFVACAKNNLTVKAQNVVRDCAQNDGEVKDANEVIACPKNNLDVIAQNKDIACAKNDLEVKAQNEVVACTKNDLKVKEKSPRVRQKLDYVFTQNASTSYCIICDIIVLNNAKNDHISETKHVVALKRYGCEAITQKNTTDFHCAHCDCMISCTENLCQHITGKKHLKSLKSITEKKENNVENVSTELHPADSLRQNSPCNYIVKINETDLRCRVCDCIMKASSLNQEIHLGGKHHAKSLKKYGCDRITIRGENIYHCEYCDVTISHIENVYDHIKKDSHMNSLTELEKTNSANTMKFPSQEEKSQKLSEAQMAKIAVEIKDLQEKANVQQMKIATRRTTDVWLEQIASSTNTPQKDSDFKKNHLTSEKISKIADNSLTSNHILKMSNRMFFCRICDCNIFSPLTVDLHIRKERHVQLLKHFYTEISSIKNDRYHCKSCNWTIYGTDNVYTHMHANRHKNSMNTSIGSQRLENARSSHAAEQYCPSKSCDVTNSHPEDVALNINETIHMNSMTVNKKQHPEATMNITSNIEVPREHLKVRTINISSKAEDFKENCPEIEAKKVSIEKGTFRQASDVRAMKTASKFEFAGVCGLACPSLSCNYVTETPSGPYCEICDVKLYNGFRRHVAGIEHSNSLKKYGCDNISLVGDDYFCACCKCKINGCENVYGHIKGRKHLLHCEAVAGNQKLEILQKKINQLETTDPGAELAFVLSSITAEISQLREQLKHNGFNEIERNEDI